MNALPVDARKPIWPAQAIRKHGVVFVATTLRYMDEAREAAAQLRRTNPHLPIFLVTDIADYTPVFWDDWVLVEHIARGFRDKILMGLCPYERFLYLDGDTHVIGDLSPVFQLLERFDFVGHQLFEGNDCPLPGVSDAFCEFNGGVLGFRRTEKTNRFFAAWLARYDVFHALNRDGHYHYSNVSDQKSLRLSVYESDLRIAILGPEYDFVPHHVDFACSPVRLIHGRGEQHLSDLASRINVVLGNRVYVPQLDAIVSAHMPSRELRRLWWMTTLQLIRRCGVGLTPLGLRDQLRRSAFIRRLFLRNRFSETSASGDPKWQENAKN